MEGPPRREAPRAITQRRLLRNASALVASYVATKAINIVVSLLLVRWLGPAELGQYAYILAYCYPFGALADIGLGSLAIREISRAPGQEAAVLSTLTRLLLGLAGSSVFTMVAIAALTHNDPRTLLGISIVGLSSLLAALTSPYLVAITAREEMHLVSLYQVASSGLGSVATLGVLMGGGSTLALLTAATAVNACLFGLARLLAGRLDRVRDLPADRYRSMLRQTLPFGLVLLGFTLYYRLDLVILRWYQPLSEVGRYAAVYRFLDTLLVLGAAIGGPFYPRLSSLVDRDPLGARRMLEATWWLMFAVALPAVVATTMLAGPLIRLLLGNQYQNAEPLLQILIWAGLPVLLIAIPGHAINALNRTWYLAGVYWLAVSVNVGLNLILIPRWGAAGAAATTVFCAWLVLVLVIRQVRTALNLSLPWTGAWRYLLATGGMAAALYLVRGAGMPVQLAAGAIAYPLGLLALGYLRSPDLAALRGVLAQ